MIIENMSWPGELLTAKTVLPPVRRLSRCLPRRSALCSPDLYENYVLPSSPDNSTNKLGKKSGQGTEPSVRNSSGGGTEGVVPAGVPSSPADPLLRLGQLEQNIRFLQEQHQSMLGSLHQEIESLRLRNRDLQFQLIFGNAGASLIQSSSDSSPDENNKPKIVVSPKEVNTRSLQAEMLEREVSELKAALSEANLKNSNLSQLVDYQKKQLDAAKKEKDTELLTKLDEADLLIKRLSKENEDLRKEINNLRSQLSSKSGGGGVGRYHGGGGGRRGGYHGGGGGGGDYQRFPPLQSQQNYWTGHDSRKQRSSPTDYPGGRGRGEGGQQGSGGGGGGGGGGGPPPEVVGQSLAASHQPPGSLPHLGRAYSQPQGQQRHRYYGNGNHFYQGSTEEGEGRRRHRGRGGAIHQNKEDH